MLKKTDGFTLVELLTGIVCTTIVTGAAMTLMFMGLRTNRALNDAAKDQQNSRIVLTMMEQMASEGQIANVVSSESGDWSLFSKDQEIPLLYYAASADAIRTADGSTLMSDVTASTASYTDQVITFSIETAEGTYSSSVYCRTGEFASGSLELGNIPETPDNTYPDFPPVINKEDDTTIDPNMQVSGDTSVGRTKLLAVVASQYGTDSGETYNLWYCGDRYWSGWNKNTPWCATFVCWAMDRIPGYFEYDSENPMPKQANVDNLWNAFEGSRHEVRTEGFNYDSVVPGDFIYFDWNNTPDSLEHVGVVFATDTYWVYTIEGNSGGKVAMHRYLKQDPSIVGFSVLNWNTNTTP